MSFTVEQPSTSPGAERVKCTAVYGWVFGFGVGFLFPRGFRLATSSGKKIAFSKAKRTCRSSALFDVSESHHLSRMIYFIAMFYLILYPSSTSSSPEKTLSPLRINSDQKKRKKSKKKGGVGGLGHFSHSLPKHCSHIKLHCFQPLLHNSEVYFYKVARQLNHLEREELLVWKHVQRSYWWNTE